VPDSRPHGRLALPDVPRLDCTSVSERVVYRTGIGRICPDCGWPAAACKCSRGAGGGAPVPAKVTAKLRLEKSGRGGKSVTVVDGLPDNDAFLRELAHRFQQTIAVRLGLEDDQRLGHQAERDDHTVGVRRPCSRAGPVCRRVYLC